MATLSTATSNFSTLVQEVVAKAAEEELRTKLVHTIPGNYQPARIIKGTNFYRFARYADVAAQTTALTEGTPPTAQALTIASEGASATQIGGVFEITDLATLDSPHDLVAINAERAGRQAASTIDILVREILAAGTSVQYVTATSRATLASSNVVTGAQVKKMVALLGKNNVPTFGDGFYRAIIHSFPVYDLFTDTANGGWMDANKYVDNMPLLAGELGRYHKVRFLETGGTGSGTNPGAKVFIDGGATSQDVFSTIFFGPGAYALIDSQPLQSYFIAPGGDHSDPIAQLAKIGWKTRFGCMLIDEAGPRYIRLESGASLGDV
jgi:N4-gp56 family major capsid protein